MDIPGNKGWGLCAGIVIVVLVLLTFCFFFYNRKNGYNVMMQPHGGSCCGGKKSQGRDYLKDEDRMVPHPPQFVKSPNPIDGPKPSELSGGVVDSLEPRAGATDIDVVNIENELWRQQLYTLTPNQYNSKFARVQF